MIGIQTRFYWNHPLALAKEEKKQIFRTSNWIGGALLLGQFVTMAMVVAFQIILVFFDHITPNGDFVHFVDEHFSYVFFSILMFVPFTALCVPLCKRRLSEVVRFDRHPLPLGLALFLMCLGVFFVGNVLSDWVYQVMNFLGHPPYLPETAAPETWLEFGLMILSSACIPALTEEFAFRGVILGLFKPYGSWFAIVVSSVLFALMHGNLVQTPFALACGIGLGYATVRSGSLWPAILAHFFNNAMSFVLQYGTELMHLDGGDLLYGVYFVFLMLAGVAGLLLVLRYNRLHPARKAPEEQAVRYTTLSERVAKVVTAPTVILFGLYCLYCISQYIL